MLAMAKHTLKPDDRAQSARFIKLAREMGATGKPEDFDRAFRKVATAPREAPKPKARKKR
jgi:hypothetical protein